MKKKNIIVISIIGVLLLALIGVLLFLANRPKNDTASQTTQTTQSSSVDPNKLELPQLSSKVADDEAEVQVQTTAGNIDIKLFPKLAPMAVENFMTLAKQGYYNNNQFFRVIKGFMIQAGDPSNTGTGSKSVVNNNQPFATEISKQLYNIRGALSLANTGQPNSSSSQFFIVQNPSDATSQIQDPTKYPLKILDAYKNGGYPQLDGSYTVFGQVISGMDAVDKIAAGAITPETQNTQAPKPVQPVSITGVKIVKDWKF